MIKNPVKTMPHKVCPECGQAVKEHTDSYIMECERCLSKKVE